MYSSRAHVVGAIGRQWLSCHIRVAEETKVKIRDNHTSELQAGTFIQALS